MSARQTAKEVALGGALILTAAIVLIVAMAGIIVWAESGPLWAVPFVCGVGFSVGIMAAGLLRRR